MTRAAQLRFFIGLGFALGVVAAVLVYDWLHP
jgi:hypothetical protein